MKIRQCEDVKLSLILKKLPLVSMQLGHVNAHGTIKDYLISSDSNIELDYICDLFNLTTKEVIDKWYGGHEEAFEIIQELDRINERHENDSVISSNREEQNE